MAQQQGCSLMQISVKDRRYYECGNTSYMEAFSGNDVHYVAVAAPHGCQLVAPRRRRSAR